MHFRSVRILFRREIIDQFRDRRTLFMIFVVPLLLYPILGLLFFQVLQFVNEKPSSILVLLDKKEGEEAVYPVLPESKLLHYAFSHGVPHGDPATLAEEMLDSKLTDAVLIVPQGTLLRLKQLSDELGKSEETNSPPDSGNQAAEEPDGDTAENETEPLRIVYSSAVEKSMLAQSRLQQTLGAWSRSLGIADLEKRGIDPAILTPVPTLSEDIAVKTGLQGVSFWSKMLPILLLLSAMTGAFYPAIDLCAGEKERGTLETLLCSPSTRGEIVLGKMLTVMCFSILTAISNVICLGATGAMVAPQIPKISAPPLFGMFWMLLPLIPVSMIFSALCLALASLARSTKEGQYYLLPMMMFVMPLIFLSIAPGTELTLGTALLPVTGIAMILRQLLEGDWSNVLRFSPIVIGITLACCYFSVRFAIRQFNQETLLFSDSQKFDPLLWGRQLFRKRAARPTFATAILCGLVILVIRYFANFAFPAPKTFGDVALTTSLLQIGIVLLPAVLFAFCLTTDPWGTLRLKVGPGGIGSCLKNVLLAGAAAVMLNPANQILGFWVSQTYSYNDALAEQLEALQQLFALAPLFVLVGLLAVLPAFCEEITFRGFLLSGLLPNAKRAVRGGTVEAILISAFFFGITHGILQQSICATVVGCVLGYIAVRSGTLWPCITFHFLHNSLAVVAAEPIGRVAQSPLLLVLTLFAGIVLLCLIRENAGTKSKSATTDL